MENPTHDENMVGFGSMDIHQMKQWAEEISGRWDGKTENGEEKALCAKEIAEKCAELEELLDEMSSYL